MTRKIARTAALAGVLALPVLAAIPASAANTMSVDSVTMLARGVAVSVTVSATCDAPSPYFNEAQFSVSLAERVAGGQVTSGSTFGLFTCDGTSHAYTVLVTPSSLAFKNGTALLRVATSYYGSEAFPGIEETVKL